MRGAANILYTGSLCSTGASQGKSQYHLCYKSRSPNTKLRSLVTQQVFLPRYGNSHRNLTCEISNEVLTTEEEEDWVEETLENEQAGSEDVSINIEKVARNTRRIFASVSLGGVPLQTVWEVLTDYEGLSDFIPSLATSQILEKRENGAQLLQIGEQELALGVKFKATAVLDVTEAPVEVIDNGLRRDVGFEMVEGDFQVFRGTWRIEQLTIMKPVECIQNEDEHSTVLYYILEVQPKNWLPVGLLEGRLRREVTRNLISVRDKAFDTLL